jgi:beta-glucosidase
MPAGAAPESDDFLLSARTGGRWKFVSLGALRMRAVDAGGVQEAGRELRWSGAEPGTFGLTGPGLDLRTAAGQGASLLLEYRVDIRLGGSITLAMGCSQGCEGGRDLDITDELKRAPVGTWQILEVRLSRFADSGFDLAAVNEPLLLRSNGPLGLTLKSVRLSDVRAKAPPAPQ